MHKKLIATSLVGLTLFVAACGGSPSASTSPSGPAETTSAATASAPESTEATSPEATVEESTPATETSAAEPSGLLGQIVGLQDSVIFEMRADKN